MAKHICPQFRAESGWISALTGSLRTGLIGLITLLALMACGGGNSRNISQADLGSVRFFNAISDGPILNFTLENSSLANLPFGQVSAFNQTRDGRFDLDVRYTALDGTVATVVDDFRTRVRQQEQTTTVLAGTIAAPIVFEISADNPDVPTGRTEFHIVNTANAGTVDVYLTGLGNELGTLTASVANNAASELISADSGTRRLRVTAAGSGDVIYDSGSFELSSGRRLLFHVQPYFGPGDTPLRVSNIEGSRATGFANEQLPVSLRVANAIADVAATDVSIEIAGSTTQTNDVPVNSFAPAQLLDAGQVTLQANLPTDPGTVFYGDTQQLVAGEKRTLLVAGSFANNTTAGRLTLDPQRPLSTAAQINILQGTISAERVDVYFLSGTDTTDNTTATISNLALLANATREILAGTYEVVVTQNGSNTVLAGPESVTLTNGDIRTILLTDADGGGLPPQIIFGEQP